MPLPYHKLDLLWTRLENAKLQLDFALNYTNEISADKLSGDIPVPDGYYARRNAIRGEEQAIKRYLCALRDFQAALALEGGPCGVLEHEEQPRAHAGLSPRERQVLALIASGKSSKQIAVDLGMAFRTVVCHRQRIYQKLKVHTSVELTRAALQMGLVDH